jgi:hypothetical protein
MTKAVAAVIHKEEAVMADRTRRVLSFGGSAPALFFHSSPRRRRRRRRRRRGMNPMSRVVLVVAGDRVAIPKRWTPIEPGRHLSCRQTLRIHSTTLLLTGFL